MPSGKRHEPRQRLPQPQSIHSHPILSQFDDDDATFHSPPLLEWDTPPQNSDPEPDIERDGVSGAEPASIDAVVHETRRDYREDDRVARSPASVSADDGGHVRSPILARHPTRLDALSRTVRNYVPSSIAIAIPSAAPTPPRVSRPVSFGKFMSPAAVRRQSSGTDGTLPALNDAFGIGDQEQDAIAPRGGRARYPGSDDSERITWARWDALPTGAGAKSRRLLLLGYPSGLQIWDCSNLDAVRDILNISRPEWGRIVTAGILPTPSSSRDPLAASRPCLGIIARAPNKDPEFIVYSLSTHTALKTLSFRGLVSFSANANFIIISTSTPPTLRILSTSTLATLSIIPAASLSAFTHHTQPNDKDTNPVFLPSPIDTDTAPQPVFALAGRFLAFASPPPRVDPAPGTAMRASTPPDLGSMALRVGGTVLSGVRSLGEAAYSAVSGDTPHLPATPSAGGFLSGVSGLFSRSAPADTAAGAVVNLGDDAPAAPTGTGGSHVTVLDLAPLLGVTSAPAEAVATFGLPRGAAVAGLRFAADGTSLAVVPADGQTVKVFQLRVVPRVLRHLGRADGEDASPQEQGTPWHVYDLRRGRTSAVVDSVDWAPDGRWVALGSRKRTVHVFATNPYGGRPDERSHTLGRVFNCEQLPPLSTALAPLVRVRAPQASEPAAPLAFTFIGPETVLPSSLLPAPMPASPTPSSPEPRPRRATNVQDLLVFDPADGALSLRRVFVEARAADAAPPPPTSVSLPARPSFGSPPQVASGLSRMMDRPAELAGRDTDVAAWRLRRGRDWEEVRRPIIADAQPPRRAAKGAGGMNWLAHAELQTSSTAPRVLPRPIYLAHQFAFLALADDYHGLLRAYHLAVPGARIDVRREVELTGAAFVHAGAQDIASSFDDALSSGLENRGSSPPVIPMFPNGAPGGGSSGVRSAAAIPIQRLSDGVGRIRRGLGSRVRGARGSVPLEFDEADFVYEDDGDGSTSRGEPSVSTPSTGDGAGGDADVDDAVWLGGAAEDMAAVEDAERFHEISVVGFMDEEQAHMKGRGGFAGKGGR